MSQESNSSYDRSMDLRARWEADAREEALSYDEEVARWGVADRWDDESRDDEYNGPEAGADDGPSLGLFKADGTWNYDREDLSDTPF